MYNRKFIHPYIHTSIHPLIHRDISMSTLLHNITSTSSEADNEDFRFGLFIICLMVGSLLICLSVTLYNCYASWQVEKGRKPCCYYCA